MANWLIDNANVKRGTTYTRHLDIFRNFSVSTESGSPKEIRTGNPVVRTHTAVDPRNVKLFNSGSGIGIGLTSPAENSSTKLADLDLDAMKTWLDANAVTSPVIAFGYVFASNDEDVTQKHALENARYITSKYNPSLKQTDMIDIKDGSTVWSSPDTKDMVVYFMAGKVDGIADTYYILLNAMRTEMYETLIDTTNHKFETIELGTGTYSDFLIKPVFDNATLQQDDVVLVTNDTFYFNPFGSEWYTTVGIDTSTVRFNLQTNLNWTQETSQRYKFTMGTDKQGVIVFEILGGSTDADPLSKIQRVFKVYRI